VRPEPCGRPPGRGSGNDGSCRPGNPTLYAQNDTRDEMEPISNGTTKIDGKPVLAAAIRVEAEEPAPLLQRATAGNGRVGRYVRRAVFGLCEAGQGSFVTQT
jgi:hypothetical protein